MKIWLYYMLNYQNTYNISPSLFTIN